MRRHWSVGIDLDSLNLWVDPLNNGHHKLELADLTEAFDLKVIDEDKVWIPGYVPFQYGDEAGVVSWKNKLRPKIVRMLEARGLPLPQFKDIPHVHNDHPPSDADASPTHGVKEEDKDKVEDKEIIPEEGSGEKPGREREIRSAEDLKRRIPLVYREKWALMYPALRLARRANRPSLRLPFRGPDPAATNHGPVDAKAGDVALDRVVQAAGRSEFRRGGRSDHGELG
jgi:hypothetical protein